MLLLSELKTLLGDTEPGKKSGSMMILIVMNVQSNIYNMQEYACYICQRQQTL